MDLKDRKFPLSTKLAAVSAFAFLPDLSFGLRIVLTDCLKIEIHWHWGMFTLIRDGLSNPFLWQERGILSEKVQALKTASKEQKMCVTEWRNREGLEAGRRILSFYRNVSLTFDPICAGIKYRFTKHKLNLERDVQGGVTIISPPLLSIKYELCLGKSPEWLTPLLSLLPLHFPAIAINLLAFRNWLGWSDLIPTWFSSDPINTQESPSHSMSCLLFL